MSEENLKDRIIVAARERFMAMGFSKVTMDELVRQLGISKKTMYQHFRSKDELLEAVVEWQIIEISGKLRTIMDSPGDFAEKLLGLWALIGNMLSRFSKQMQDDLRRFRPDLWKRIDEVRRKNVRANFALLIDDGIRMNFIRPDVNKDLLMLIFLNSVSGILNPEVLVDQPFTAEQAFKTIFRVLLDGVLTDKAREHFRKKMFD
jgi:AcrR family transcriptional regulator